MQQASDIIERVRRGDLNGLNFAGLARLSFELDPDKETPVIPLTGADINGREDQERKLCAKLEEMGARYIGTYHEPNTSAWKRRKVTLPDGRIVYRVIRPVYADTLEDLKRGQVTSQYFRPAPGVELPVTLDGFGVIEIDRLTRDNIDLEDAINVVVHHQRPIIDVTGTLDLLTDNGRDMARILVTMKGRQSADTSRRVRDKHYAIAMNGIPIGGNRPFGWQQDKRTLDPKESELLRQAAQLVIRKVGVTTIAKYWAEKGIRSPGGKVMGKRTLETMLISPRIVGWRVYGPTNQPPQERYIRDANGQPIKGQHEPILDVETWQAVVSILNSRSQQGNYIAGKRKYKLSGIMRCSECGKRLIGYAVRNGRFAYACKKTVEMGGCGKVSGAGIAIDEHITKLLFAYLEQHQVIKEPEMWAGTDELARLNETKADLLKQFKANPDMGNYIWPQIREIDAGMARLTKERAAHNRGSSKPTVTSILETWDDLEVEQQRAVFDEVFEAVVLSPANKCNNTFDLSRLSVVYRQE